MTKHPIWLGVAFLTLIFASLACSFSFSTAEIQNLRIAKDQDGNTTTAQFKPEENIFLVGDLSKAPDDTHLKATWIAVAAEGVDANKVIWEHEEDRGDGKFAIKLPVEAGPRPAGRYKIDLYLNGELNKSLDFEVLKSDATPTPSMEQFPVEGGASPLVNVHTSRDEADSQPTSVFAQSDVIYTHFGLDVPEGQALVKGTLTAMTAEGVAPETVFAETENNFPAGAQWIRFVNSGPWPLGIYRIDMALNGMIVQSLQIEVAATNTSGAQIQNVFSSSDQNGQQPTNTFATTGSIYVQFTLANAPADTNIRGVMVTANVQGMEPNTQVTEAGGQLGDGSYWFEFFNDGPWPVGTYTIYIYLNGQFSAQVDVQVQ